MAGMGPETANICSILSHQLAAALWTCQQLPESCCCKGHIQQLLEVALDLSKGSAAPPPTPPPAAAVGHIPVTPAGQEPSSLFYRHQHEQQQQQSAWYRPYSSVRRRRTTRRQAAAARCAERSSPACTGLQVPAHVAGAAVAPKTPPSAAATTITGGSAGRRAATSRFSALDAERVALAGLPGEQADMIAEAMSDLCSADEAVQAAAAQQLQGVTASQHNPEAVAQALVAAEAIPLLVSLLGSSSALCKVAAAGTLCNLAWYAQPRVAIMASGGVLLLVAMLWADESACRTEAALALTALTADGDEPVCHAVAEAGGIPRLIALVTGSFSNTTSSSSAADALGCGSSCEQAAALRALGRLAADSAGRRASIASTSGVLQQILDLLSSQDASCREAALGTLLRLASNCSCGQPEASLSDAIICGLLKGAGVEEVLQGFVSSTGSTLNEAHQAGLLLDWLTTASSTTFPCVVIEELANN